MSFAPTVAAAVAFYAPEARPVIAAAVERGVTTGEAWELVLPLVTARGRRLWVNALGQVEFRGGKPYRLFGTFQDVTDRLNNERALKDSEARYRHLFENAPVAIWEEDFSRVGVWFDELRAAGVTDLGAYLAADPDAVMEGVRLVRVRDVNRAAVEQNGAADKADLIANLGVLFGPEARAAFAEELAALWGGARHVRLETRTRKISGGEVDLVLNQHVAEADGRPDLSQVVLIAFDVTEQKRLEDQFRQAAKLEAVGRLAGGIAHDFNNLLTVINGFSEILQHQFPPDTPTGELVGQIHDAGARAAGLTRQLLAFSRRQSVPTTAVDVRAVVDGLRPLLVPLVGEGVRVVIAPGPPPPPVRADHGQIEQVVMNLCVNARDAMPGGGTLTVATGFIDLADGPADDVPAGRYVVLSVADSGEGIPEHVRPHVFDPFFTTKELGKGTGLGLSTVYGIVSQAGGHVRFDSAVGAGTTFRVYLPATDDPVAARPAKPDAVPAVAAGRVVLLVEDEPSVRLLSEAVLVEGGFEVLAAESGPAALALLEKTPRGIELLVTDVAMPGMTGRVLANRLKEVYSRLLVVFVSGYTPEEIETGPGEVFLPKPFGPDDLTRAIHGLLAGRS